MLTIQISQKLRLVQGYDDVLDEVIRRFRFLDVSRFSLSAFEQYLVDEVRRDL
jgi:hypothetical protein